MMQLPELPDDDKDFTPDIARKIVARYQAIIRNLTVQPGERPDQSPATASFDATARMDQDAFLELAHLETRKRYRALMAAGFVDSFVEGAKWATALAQQPNQRGWLLIKDAPLNISGPVWSPEPAWANRTDIAGEVKSHESGVRYVVGQFLGFKPTHWHPPVTPPLAAEPEREGKI